MIFGYVSKKEYPRIEDEMYEADPEGRPLHYSAGGDNAFLFIGSNSYCRQPLWESSDTLVVCNGIPVEGSYADHYRIPDTLPESIVKGGAPAILNDIVSNVSLCILQNNGGRLRVTLSSDRVSPYKFYYRHVDSTLFFSTNYSLLMKLAPCRVSKASLYLTFKYNMPPTPDTIVEEISVVPPSHYYVYEMPGGQGNCYPYFQFAYGRSEKADLRNVDRILEAEAAVINEMNPAMLMSGGVDSTLFAFKLRDRQKKKGTAYFCSYGSEDPELEYAVQAAEASGHRLITANMNESDLVRTTGEIGKLSCMPFNDFSFITTYYLMKHINGNGGGAVVDCTGADGCFGFYLLTDKSRWVNAHRLPKPLKRLLANVYSRNSIWMHAGRAETVLGFMAMADNPRLEVCPSITMPNNRIFPYNRTYEDEADRSFDHIVSTLNNGDHGGFEEYVTTLDLIHNCGTVCSQKTYLSDDLTSTMPVYPFLWRDMLLEQGSLSWGLKVKDGIMKYPLKKLLENYMPHDFVHRPKSGFTLTLSKAFTGKPMIEMLTSVDRSKFAGVIDGKKVDDILARISGAGPNESLPNPVKFSIWGMIYFDQWARNHPVTCSN